MILHLSNTSDEDFATLRETMWTVLEAASKLRGQLCVGPTAQKVLHMKCIAGSLSGQVGVGRFLL